MERYKNIIRIEQMKENIRSGRMEAALELADKLDPVKVKNYSDLTIMADLYLENGMLAKAEDCLNELYTRRKTRSILMQLINLSIRLKRANDAEKYYMEFRAQAPQDFYNHIFRYSIDKIEGKSYDVLIASLEKLKEAEYIDTWAYELAKLYHKAGRKEDCLSECNDIEIWFGDGEYVERARALKAYYSGEISLAQMNAGQYNLGGESDSDNAAETDESSEYAEEDAVSEYSEEEDANLEYADGSLISDSEPSDSALIPDTELVEGAVISDTELVEVTSEETEEDVDITVATESGEVGSAEGGRTYAEGDEEAEAITGSQSDPEDNNDAENAETTMSNHSDSDNANVAVTVADSQSQSDKANPADDDITDTEIAREVLKGIIGEESDSFGNDVPKETNPSEKTVPTETTPEDTAEPKEECESPRDTAEVSVTEDSRVAFYGEAEGSTQGYSSEEQRLEEELEINLAAEVLAEIEGYEAEQDTKPSSTNGAAEENKQNELKGATAEKTEEVEIGVPEIVEHEFKALKSAQIPEGSILADFLKSRNVTFEEYFSFFAYQPEIRSQLIKNLEILLNPQYKNKCLIISGERNSGMKGIIKGVTKMLYQNGVLTGQQVAFTDAEKINNMSLLDKKDKLNGCCLAIGNAGRMQTKAVAQLLELNKAFTEKTMVVLTDYRSELNRLFRDNRELNNMFPQRIHFPTFDKEDLEDLAFYKLNSEGYEIDKPACELMQKELRRIVREVREGSLAEADRFVGLIIDSIETRNAQKMLAGGFESAKDKDRIIVLKDVKYALEAGEEE